MLIESDAMLHHLLTFTESDSVWHAFCDENRLVWMDNSVRNKEQMVGRQMYGNCHFGTDNFSFAQTYFGEAHVCHSRCASSGHSQYK